MRACVRACVCACGCVCVCVYVCVCGGGGLGHNNVTWAWGLRWWVASEFFCDTTLQRIMISARYQIIVCAQNLIYWHCFKAGSRLSTAI